MGYAHKWMCTTSWWGLVPLQNKVVGWQVFERGYWKGGKEEGEEVKVLKASESVEGAQAGSDDIQVTLHYRVVLRYVFVIIQMFELLIVLTSCIIM